MKGVIRYTILSLLVFGVGISIGSSIEWTLKKNDDAITVYTKDFPSSAIKEVRVVDTVNSSMAAIVAIMLDMGSYPSWIYHCNEARTLNVINGQEQYRYIKLSVPWPFDDREMVGFLKITQDSATKKVFLTTTGTPDYIKPNDNIVRVKEYKAQYILTPLPHGRVVIDFVLHLDPSGSLPAWLINSNIVSGPYYTAFQMRKRLAEYQTAHFPFVKE